MTLFPTTSFRWFRPKGGSDADMVLQQLMRTAAGKDVWVPVRVVLENEP